MNTMASRSNLPLPTTLKLPEAVEFMAAHLNCSPAHARHMLERAIYDGSLNKTRMIHTDGGRIDTKEVGDWRHINWETGIVEVEGFCPGMSSPGPSHFRHILNPDIHTARISSFPSLPAVGLRWHYC